MTPHEISYTIFYLPATNGKAEESVQKGADMIEQYAILREQEAFWAGQNSVIDSINLQQNRQTFEDWKEATK